ncbi:MAG: hypothetical protein DK304_000288 [Chloroflexi bacterium]|jgi:GTP-binding protein YchF|nr:MAG: hypothetical protein DK304_000288 [Chloroflexota bacterium]
MKLGIIGLAKSGKTTVFNALTRGSASTTASGLTDPNIGIAKVPDTRLNVLVEIFNPKKITQAEVYYIDVPATPEGLGQDHGISGKYLNELQTTDALVLVVRAFENPSVPHVSTNVDPSRDLDTLLIELNLSDVVILERRLSKLDAETKGANTAERTRIGKEHKFLESIRQNLGQGIAIKDQNINQADLAQLSVFQLLTAKPLLVLINIGEEQLVDAQQLENELNNQIERSGISCIAMCARLEEELTSMDEEEEKTFRESLGAGESAYGKVIQSSYELLGLVSFLTVGPDEVRAWTISDNTGAAQAAGKIHSDIERGFIRAETVSYHDLVTSGSMTDAKRKGLVRSEGRTYLVKDGDVINFLFNV